MFNLYVTLKWTNSLKRLIKLCKVSLYTASKDWGLKVHLSVIELQCDEDKRQEKKETATYTGGKGYEGKSQEKV